jgi:hypothetical protein
MTNDSLKRGSYSIKLNCSRATTEENLTNCRYLGLVDPSHIQPPLRRLLHIVYTESYQE